MMTLSEERAALGRMQALYVRLFYSQELVTIYEKTPELVLRDFDLDLSYRHMLPDTKTEGHRAEMHGRRIRVLSELKAVYKDTIKVLAGNSYSDAFIMQSVWFTEFLSSEEFFKAKWSLRHPTGIGRGYEGVTRFFFWTRRHFGLQKLNAPLKLRFELNVDFASFLDWTRRRSLERYYRRFKNGIYWRNSPGKSNLITIFAPERELIEMESKFAIRKLVKLGLVDLDEVVP